MYLRAQGLRESEAYRALQLAPHAPHELIVETYWALVSRTRQGDAPHADGDDIGAAYALLVDGCRPPDARLALHDPAAPGEHYAALCVDPAADAGIIDAAYSFLERNRQRMKRSHWRAIEESYRVLANPKLRAQYDASRNATPRLAIAERPAAPAEVPDVEPRRRGFFGRSGRVPAADPRDTRLLGLRGAALASLPEPAVMAAPVLVSRSNAVAELVFVAGLQAGLRVPLDDSPVSIGAAPDDHVVLDGIDGQGGVHIWKHGDGFMLRQQGVALVLVEGRKLDLPVVTLEDGDEITYGSHRLRFRNIAQRLTP